jgi:CheY-like chemotaxis protein
VKCEFTIAEDLWPVRVDLGQFSQVIHNLVINAVQAMPQGGTIRLHAHNTALEALSGLPLKAGRYVKISMQDEGLGIPREHLAKVFDPYFTSKHQGSGLGLTMTYSTIQAHDGHIEVDSEMGKGTTFRIYMPASHEELVENEDRAARLKKGEGKILVMDDEETIRNVTKKILMGLGYEVRCASDGAETITLYQEAARMGRPFDAVIMDLTIPGGMGGKEAIRQLLSIDPQATASVSSGYSNDPIMSEFEKYGFRGVATKPYRIEKLSWVLHDVLMAAKERA